MIIAKESTHHLPMKLWNQQPIELIDAGRKKILNSLDIMALRFCAGKLLRSWYEEMGLDPPDDQDDSNAILGNELYLGNFEGWELEEGVILRTLYMSENSCIIAHTTIDDDKIVDYLVY